MVQLLQHNTTLSAPSSKVVCEIGMAIEPLAKCSPQVSYPIQADAAPIPSCSRHLKQVMTSFFIPLSPRSLQPLVPPYEPHLTTRRHEGLQQGDRCSASEDSILRAELLTSGLAQA